MVLIGLMFLVGSCASLGPAPDCPEDYHWTVSGCVITDDDNIDADVGADDSDASDASID